MTEQNIFFNFNNKKILEVVLWLANEKPGISFHTLAKVLFFADVAHLNKYGRPITGDNWCAMPYGPVPSYTYDLLKEHPDIIESIQEDTMPFYTKKNGTKPCIYAKRQAETDYLSKSDIDELKTALEKYGNLSFGDLTDISHKNIAWQEAWNGRNNESPQMKFELMIEDEELREEIKEMCRGIQF